MNEMRKFNATFEYKLIYVFRINDNKHKGCLKVGDATIYTSKIFTGLLPNCHDLNHAARERIDSYTSTAGVVYDLLHTEIAVYSNNKKFKAFRDYKVHEVLKRSGIRIKQFETNKVQNEWFVTDLQTVRNAIKAVKEGKSALNSNQISEVKNPIVFRPEQIDAIKKTIARFKNETRMLWNAKMRFGKTLSALQVTKEMNFKRTIILTHRPVVSEGWFEDFSKIFYDKPDYFFGSKFRGKTISDLLFNNDNFVYFASIQDLRGSDIVGGNFDKNNEIFSSEWDFIVVDEAHEGTKTDLGKKVLKALIKEDSKHKTYVLELSGTPFNLLMDYDLESIYTWDYIMEQEAKTTWDQYHFGDSNPYDELPRMNIYTYHLEKTLPVYIDVMDKAFNFREFFRLRVDNSEKDAKQPPIESKGSFVHEQDVKAFLDLMCKEDEKTNYPFATQEYRDFFRHSLWVLPGVKEAKAISNLLKQHHVFKHFSIVNVAGDGDDEIDTKDALRAVKKAITDAPDSTYTITLSCSRLTTGVSVPEWTAVLMLSGTYSTSASQYLQTIFRVQTPANINGKVKSECYVFDFAPDRTLKMVAESVQLSARAGSKNPVAEIALKKFLNFCPVISIEDSIMKEYKVSELLQELKKAYAERVARNGFDDPKIYNDDLLRLTEVELKEFDDLKRIVGDSKQTRKPGEIDINKQGFNEEESEEEKELKKKRKKDLTEDEKARLEELKEKRKNRDSAISILRAISIRMPLLVYGFNINIDTDVTIDSFADLIDETSWMEFMPKGVTKDIFKRFSKYYDKDIFVAASRRIRYIAKSADEFNPTERVLKIASLFTTFKNPDKETVLTPWKVVNIHLSSTLGGYNFYDSQTSSFFDDPEYINLGKITNQLFENNTVKILEINSKTGLYPLFVAYSIYRFKLKKYDESELTSEKLQEVWDETIFNNIFIICKTPMAKLITKRTLLGYKDARFNAHYFDDLVNMLRNKPKQFTDKVLKSSYWKKEGNDDMKFNAVVGNPPYQENIDNRGEQPPLYHLFYEVSFLISDIVTLITPARFLFEAGKTPAVWNSKMLNDKHFKVVQYFPNSKDIFSNVDIKGGVAIGLRNKNEDFGPIGQFIPHDFVKDILDKVKIRNSTSINTILFSNTSFKYSTSFFSENAGFSNRVSGGSSKYLSSSVFDKFPEVFFETKPNDKHSYVKILGRRDNQRAEFFFREDYLLPHHNLKKYKVFVASSSGSGLFGESLSEMIIGNPDVGATETFISFGPFDNKDEAKILIKYLKTRFCRLLLSTRKVTQGNKNFKVWENVPLISLKADSGIDWSLSVAEIDKQLFNIFNLSEDEVAFIVSKVQEMK